MKKAWQSSLALVFLVPGMAMAMAEDAFTFPIPKLKATLATAAPESAERKTNAAWWLGTGFQHFSEGKDDGTGAVVKAGLLLKRKLTGWARFHFEPEARFYSSRVQTRYQNDVMASAFRVRDGFAAFGVEDTFELQAGILSQKVLRTDLLIGRRRAFPGGREVFTAGNDKMQFKAFAQQLVPTSNSLNTERSERESTPTLLTETLEFGLTPAKMFEAMFYATHYRFNHLPAVVAFESATLGNSVTGDVPAVSEFRHGFDGFALGTDLNFNVAGPLTFRTGGKWLQNTAAPSGSNRGQLLYLGADLHLVHGIVLMPEFQVFFNESDTAPGYYNSFEMGNNNRKGLTGRLEVDFKEEGFSIELQYTQAAMINPDPFQADKQVFLVEVKTDNVPF
jgi:hypothetical protein